MKYNSTSLVSTIDGFRRGQTEIGAYYDDLETRFAPIEEDIQSFVKPPDFTAIQQRISRITEKWGQADILPPLYGADVAVKDIFRVDGFETRAGTTIPAKAFRGPEAPVVTALREAGAIITGKTVATEFAYSPTGPTRNPHNLEHTPGGSSSGSAAAVAAGLASLALGTQTVGSVIRPAAFCGIVGFKPSIGRIPTEGIIPFSQSADQVGMFTQHLQGMKLASSVICESWMSESVGTDIPTVGVPSGPYLEQASETGREHFESNLEALSRSGIEIKRLHLFDDIDEINELHSLLTEAEAALAHAEWYTEYGDQYHDETATMIEEGWETDLSTVGRGRQSQQSTRDRITAVMKDSDVDVLLSPSAPGPAPKGIEDSGSPIMNLPWTHAGVPALTLPAGTTDDGLPLGVQFTSEYGSDERLLMIAERVLKIIDGEN